MSIHPSLNVGGGALSRHRNVLTRAERIVRLQADGRQVDEPLGLPKVGNRKVLAAGKKKKGAEAEGEATK